MTIQQAIWTLIDCRRLLINGLVLVQAEEITEAFDMAIEALKAEPKMGKWVKHDSVYHTAICSECEKVTMFEVWGGEEKPYDYCPNCGSYNGGDKDD